MSYALFRIFRPHSPRPKSPERSRSMDAGSGTVEISASNELDRPFPDVWVIVTTWVMENGPAPPPTPLLVLATPQALEAQNSSKVSL